MAFHKMRCRKQYVKRIISVHVHVRLIILTVAMYQINIKMEVSLATWTVYIAAVVKLLSYRESLTGNPSTNCD